MNFFKGRARYIIFIVIKNREQHSASYEKMYTMLVNLKQVFKEHNIDYIIMIKLGQTDNLEWEKVSAMIRYIYMVK